MKIRINYKHLPCLILNGLHVVLLAEQGKSSWHLICILWALNRRSFWVKLSCTVKDGITAINNTVAQLEVSFAESVAETIFFFLFNTKGKKPGKNNVMLFYIVRAHTCTKVFYDNFVLAIFTFIA